TRLGGQQTIPVGNARGEMSPLKRRRIPRGRAAGLCHNCQSTALPCQWTRTFPFAMTSPRSLNMPHRHRGLPMGRVRGHLHLILQVIVLVAGLLAMIVNTMPSLGSETRLALSFVLWGCLGVFAGEWAVKAWPKPDPAAAAKYIRSSRGVIDLLCIVPIPAALLLGVPASLAWLLASLWLFKLAAWTPGLSLLRRVIVLEARPLVSVLVIFLVVLLLSSVALYLLERTDQPEHFGSLPLALWWAVTTLTGTGYGDSIPHTAVGRMIAGVVMICGLGVAGLWTGILATGFAAEYRRRAFVRNWDLVTRVPFLRNLDPPSIIELTHMLRHIDVAEGIVVVRQGRPGDCMYFVADGEVEVLVEPQPIRLGPGSFFGEIALLTGGPRMATVVTTAPSTLLSLEVADFRAFTAHHPHLAEEVAAEAARRTGKAKTAESETAAISRSPAVKSEAPAGRG
ncbi:MAG TPA: ion transporter, partial [Pseudolabrys sp.]|nr:ion transporter [Pseudolabrys sp.]